MLPEWTEDVVDGLSGEWSVIELWRQGPQQRLEQPSPHSERVLVVGRAAVRGKRLFFSFLFFWRGGRRFILKPKICQDRLGTNIGKQTSKRDSFSAYREA
jgi:hypothetical protein